MDDGKQYGLYWDTRIPLHYRLILQAETLPAGAKKKRDAIRTDAEAVRTEQQNLFEGGSAKENSAQATVIVCIRIQQTPGTMVAAIPLTTV